MLLDTSIASGMDACMTVLGESSGRTCFRRRLQEFLPSRGLVIDLRSRWRCHDTNVTLTEKAVGISEAFCLGGKLLHVAVSL